MGLRSWFNKRYELDKPFTEKLKEHQDNDWNTWLATMDSQQKMRLELKKLKRQLEEQESKPDGAPLLAQLFHFADQTKRKIDYLEDCLEHGTSSDVETKAHALRQLHEKYDRIKHDCADIIAKNPEFGEDIENQFIEEKKKLLGLK